VSAPSSRLLVTLTRSLIRILALAEKETHHIRRDPQTLALALAMPVGLLLLFGYGVTFDLDRLPLVVVDQDQTSTSRSVIETFAHSGDLVVAGRAVSTEEAEASLRGGQAVGVLVIPRGFSRALARGERATLQLVVDGADASTATQTVNKADATAMAAVLVPQHTAITQIPRLVGQSWILYNPEMRSTFMLVPGLMAYILAVVCVLLTALTVAREWERGSMEQLFTTPVRRGELILGKLLPYVALGGMGVLLVLAVGAWAFEVPIRGSIPALGTAALLFLVGMLAQGLFVSVVTKNQMVATQVGTLSSMLPTQLLSGFVFPVANMPAPLQLIANLLPATHFIAALRGILLRGNGFREQGSHLLALAAFAVVMTTITALRFRRRLD
jgi:ABC-2 type transport system permease protein